MLDWYAMAILEFEHTWMSFVDGENLTIRAQDLAESRRVELREGPYYRRNTFIWIPGWHAQARRPTGYPLIQQWAVRAHYYASFVGDDKTEDQIRDDLRTLHFSPQIFKKTRQDQKAKGVDIALTKDMLGHAFLGNYDTAVLIAGDGDYVPLVEEVKRRGRRVVVWFFRDHGLSPELLRVADDFRDVSDLFLDAWRDRAETPVTSLT